MTPNDPDVETGERLLRAITDIIPDARAAIEHILFNATEEEREGACRGTMKAAQDAVEVRGHFRDPEGYASEQAG